MAEELKQTKIPRFESGSSSVVTRIPAPSGSVRSTASTLGISKLARPQLNGIASKNSVQLNSASAATTTTTATSTASQAKGSFESTALPRKTILRRFGVANKVQIKVLPRLLGKAALKPSQLVANKVATSNDACAANETIELTKDAAMNVTKPVISAQNTDATMDRSLTRSNTFVCDTVDDTQAKLLSITHNVNALVPAPNDTMNQTNSQQWQLNKERTFKRSLSPIPGETMNSAKRKLMQVSADQTLLDAPMLNSTPRRSISYSDAQKSNQTFFNGKNVDFSSDLHISQLQTFTFDNNTFEQSNHFAADAMQLGKAASSTMQENRTANQTLDTNVAEHERKNGDASKPNALHTTHIVHDANDGNLTKTITVEKTQPIQIVGSGSLNEDLLVAKKRFSLGLELPECTLDCSIELCDSSAATSAQDSSPLVNYNPHSYEMDESLGILTPDQMIEFLDTNATHPKVELPTSLPVQIESHKCQIDHTPSPEELPLDPIEVKTLETSKIEDVDITLQPSSMCDHDGPSQADSYSKNDQMTKSTTSKVTNSFITSVTSIASLDNGYHADGEMSRPASRGAESPMRRAHNARQNKVHANGSDSDSDFFTESDADDIFHRGERRHVQIIDGHMYNAQGADIFIDEAPAENEMESSGVYTEMSSYYSFHCCNETRSIERDSSKESHLSTSRESTVATPGKQLKSTTPSSRSTARKRSSIQNGFSSNDIKIEAAAKTEPPTLKQAALHKRFSSNNNTNQTASATSSPVSEKRSTITANKKSSSSVKQHVNQSNTPVANKTSHAKEHGLQTTLAHPPSINNNNSSINNNNHSTKSGTNTTKLPPTSAVANDDHQPIIASIHRNGKTSATMAAANKAVAVPQVKTKKTGKSLPNGELSSNLIEFSMIDSHDGNSGDSKVLSNASPILDNTIRNVNQQQQQLHESTPADLNVIRANKTIVALSILIQHLTTNLKAFDTPSLRAALETAKDNFETMRTKCNSLEEQLRAKEHFFASHELALKEASERELEKLETEQSAQEQIQALRYELDEINHQHADALKAYQMRADTRCSELESQLKMSRDKERELVERLNNCTVTENLLRDKVQASEQEFAERLIAATARERELNEKVAQLTRQLKASNDKRIELEEKVKLACDETSALRHRRNSGDNCLPNGNSSVQNGGSSVMLEEEVLSLRSVLDMKLNEISELRKQNQLGQSAMDELPKAQLKISVLESRLEDLTIQLKTKVDEEQELSMHNRSLQEMYNQELKNRTRLALHNEELQWKLKQNSEKYNSTLSELSKSYQNSSLLADFKNSLYAPISETSLEHNNSDQQMNSSPPSSPGGHLVKGVVEKCDSVSYVLELNDDESTEDVVNRVVKRAGSFRANNFKERSPSFKRQLSLGANALSQSASASSLQRQHSDSAVRYIGGSVKIQKSSRTRSNSLNASNEPKKAHRLPADMTPNDYTKWHGSMKTISTSSPLTSRPHKKNGHPNGLLQIDDAGVKTRSSSMSTDDVEVEMSKPYMSCDSQADTSNLCGTILPAQNTVNKLKKRPQIKESAGEAMVSQQSEDDQSFGSDIDSASATSSSAASPSHLDAGKHRHLSLDEEAFMNKIVASLTPMEVSWSEDGDIEPYAQESSA